jgi:hypothetical protein
MKNQAHCCSPPHKTEHNLRHYLMTVSFYVMIFKFKVKNFFRELFK